MGVTKYLKQLYKKPSESLGEIYTQRLEQFRNEPTTVRVEKPTRLDRAHALGYKAKQGIIIVRQRVIRGGHTRTRKGMKRRSKGMSTRLNLALSYQRIAEMRAARKYENLEVLNSYWVGKDGMHIWYEIIMVDPKHPAIVSDKSLSWISTGKHTSRAFRGKTAAGLRGRALYRKGKGVEKARPSQGARGNLLK